MYWFVFKVELAVSLDHICKVNCVVLSLGLELIVQAIEKAGYTGKVQIGMDVAASEFCKEKKYDLDFKNKDSDPSKWVRNQLIFSALFFLFYLNAIFSLLSGG